MFFDLGELPIWAGAILIFLARVSDVTLGTLRIAFISRGEKNLAPIIGFVEMLIWLFAISQVIQNLTNVAYYFAYAGGFATGIFTGLRIEDRLALGARMIRTVMEKDAPDLLEELRAAGFGVTSVRGAGGEGDVSVIFSVVKRAEVRYYMEIVEQHDPAAFSSIEEVRSVHQGVFRPSRHPFLLGARRVFPLWKK